MKIVNAYSSVRLPRIASLMIHTVRGGHFQVMDRGSKHTHVVDCVPRHARKTDSDILQKNGVCLPINARQQRAMANSVDPKEILNGE